MATFFRDDVGDVITRRDLEELARGAANERWTLRKKAWIVLGVKHSLITRAEALQMFGLTEFELNFWERGYARAGRKGIRQRANQQHIVQRKGVGAQPAPQEDSHAHPDKRSAPQPQ